MTTANINDRTLAVYQMLSVYFGTATPERLADNAIRMFANSQTFDAAPDAELMPPCDRLRAWENGRAITNTDVKNFVAGAITDEEQKKAFVYRCVDFIQTMDIIDLADIRNITIDELSENTALISTLLYVQCVKAINIILNMTDLQARVEQQVTEQTSLREMATKLASVLGGPTAH